jgi:hypothetical protein
MSKFRFSAVLVALSAVAALAPLSSHAAGDCASDIVIFSNNATVGRSANPWAAMCVADPAQDAGDFHVINPGSDQISVRYTTDLGAATPEITAVLNGKGFTSKEIVLKRTPSTTGGFTYDSPNVPLPAGAASTGCVTASIPELEESNSSHTLDSSC